MQEGGPPCPGFIDARAARAASSVRRIAGSPRRGRAATGGPERVLDDLPLRRSVDLLEPHAIGEAPVRRLLLPHDLGQGLDVIRRLVDVELDLDPVADLARRRRDDACAVARDVDRPGPEAGPAALGAAP